MASEGRGIRVCPECGQTSNTGICPEHQRVLLPPNRRARLTSAPLLGYVLDERFVLVDRIGGGGMSVVYAALQRPLGRLVAVKVLHAQLTATKGARDRFEREARTVSLLKSRNTVTLFDFGVSKGGAMPSVAYMVMEYVAGESLAARLKRVGALPPADVARIVRDVGRSLHEAHQKGIVHRDMKPANVILTTVGDEDDETTTGSKELAKVIDFGIARLEDTAMTQTGILLGTPNYMAPELFEGGRDVDARADVYALGVMTFQMLAGYKPFKEEGGPLGVLWHHANSPVPPLPGSNIDPKLRAIDAVIRKAMGKKPDDRYPTVRAMVEALLAALGEGGKLGDEDVIELDDDDIELSPEVRELTNQYQLDVVDPRGELLRSPDTAPAEPERSERPTTRRPGAALEERATVPRRSEARVEPRVEPRVERRSEPRQEPRQELRAEPRPEPRPEPRNEPRPEPRNEPRPEPRPEPRTEPFGRLEAPGHALLPLSEERRPGRLDAEPLREAPRPPSEAPRPVGGHPTRGAPPPARSTGLDTELDTLGARPGRGEARRESHGFRGLLILGLLVVLGGGAALFLLDRPSGTPAEAQAAAGTTAPDSVAATPETVVATPDTAPDTAAPDTAAPDTAAPDSVAAPDTAAPDTLAAPDTAGAPPTVAVEIAPETTAPRKLPEAPRSAPDRSARIEAGAAAVQAALTAGDCVQARRLFRELDELPGSTAAVGSLSPGLAACRAGGPVKVVVAPDAEDAPRSEPPPEGGRKPARIVSGAPRVQGGLAAGDVQAALRRMLSSAPLGCIGKHPLALTEPAELTVSLRVTAAGQLIDAALGQSGVGNPPFERCVVNSLRALEFPASADASRIELPLKVVPGE